MSDDKKTENKPNPFMGFADNAAPAKPAAPAAAPVKPVSNAPTVANAQAADQQKANPFMGFAGPDQNAEFFAVPDRVKAEMGVGAVGGALWHHRQNKADRAAQTLANEAIMHLPPDQRPMDASSMQRYLNSQLNAKIPLEKLEELTGMRIATPKEAQKAITLIQGSPMEREPVVKDVNGRRTTVAYRMTPAKPLIDLSPWQATAAAEPTMMQRAGNAITSGAKGLAQGAMNWMRPIAGGAIAAPQLLEAGTDYLHNKPVDPTQVASGLGGLAMMSRVPFFSNAGALAQLPYAVQHREDITKALTWHDVNPTAFPIGSPGADEPFVPPK